MFLQINSTNSWTGKIIYSDVYRVHPADPKLDKSPYTSDFSYHQSEVPILNQWATIPIIGRIAGIVRFVIAILHIVGHFLAAIFTCNSDHLKHAAKGCSEALRGCLESIPIIGEILSWYLNRPIDNRQFFDQDRPFYHSTFFIIKLTNLQQPDKVDAFFVSQKAHPFAEKLENTFAMEHEKVMLPYLDKILNNYLAQWEEYQSKCTPRYHESIKIWDLYFITGQRPVKIEDVYNQVTTLLDENEKTGQMRQEKITEYRNKIDMNKDGSILNQCKQKRDALFATRKKDIKHLINQKNSGTIPANNSHQQLFHLISQDIEALYNVGCITDQMKEAYYKDLNIPSQPIKK